MRNRSTPRSLSPGRGNVRLTPCCRGGRLFLVTSITSSSSAARRVHSPGASGPRHSIADSIAFKRSSEGPFDAGGRSGPCRVCVRFPSPILQFSLRENQPCRLSAPSSVALGPWMRFSIHPNPCSPVHWSIAGGRPPIPFIHQFLLPFGHPSLSRRDSVNPLHPLSDPFHWSSPFTNRPCLDRSCPSVNPSN